MDKNDIRIYLSARKSEARIKVLQIFTIGIMSVFITLQAFGIEIPIFSYAVSGLVIASLAASIGGWASPSKSELLDIIEREINNNPSALRYISGKE
ncbi:hypothetical protein [Arsukibacterium perlucidum]|uniref:hypothetical protein n=1 Tax=Arsukibacterium perlucidum TaxID=368811 RepID=UPI00038057BE|nr:hypothetical protein [Arsukibacterium perlucidum]